MRKLLQILLLLLVPLISTAELRGPDFNFVHISTENGLPSNRVRDIVQDADGFMWFATDGGLVRYDGRHTKVFEPLNPQKPEEDVYVMTLAPYKEGLLVGTDKGLYGYDPSKEKLALLPVIDNEKEYLSGNILSLAVDQDDTVWVSVEKEGIYKITSDGKLAKNYTFSETANYISKIYIDDLNTIWAVCNYGEGYIFKFDRRESQFRQFLLTVDGVKRNFSGSTLMKDDRGQYWLGTWDEGLVRFNGTSGEGKRFCHNDVVPLWHVHSITQYSPDLLLVGSDSGLMLLDLMSGDCCVYLQDELNPESMSGRFVYPITKDSDGGIWIGTFYRGINYLGKVSSRFHSWHHSLYTNSVAGNVVSRLCEDQNGNIWIGTADGGLCQYNPQTRNFRRYSLTDHKEADNINALCSDGNRLWVGMYTDGAGYVDINSGKWTQIPVEGEKRTSCYAILRDASGKIWMGATQNLTLFNPEKNLFEKVCDLKAWITDIDQDSNGALWLATQGKGLFKYNPFTRELVRFKNTGEKNSLPHNHINSIKIIEGNQIFISTPKGVCKYNSAENNFLPLEGYPEGVPANSLEKSGDDIWVSSNNGMILLKSDGNWRNFDVSDGLGENQFLPGSSLTASDGRLYFGNVNGFSAIDPLAVSSNSRVPNLKFTSLNLINNPIEVGDKPLPSSLNSIDKLELDNSDHTFTVFFSALSYDNPQANRYKYKLEGFDKSWHESDGVNGASYSNLPPGTYTLKVVGANSDGVWNEDGISLKIVVKPVWYLSTLMKLLYLLVALTILILFVRFILWKLERSHLKELEKISDNQEKEMFRSKLNFFTVVAHEIRTPVSLIIGPLEKVMASGEKFNDAIKADLQVIDRNAKRLLSLVNQLLDYKKVEDNALPIGFRHENIIAQLESIVNRFRPSMEHKGITLETDFPDSNLEVDVDPEAITKLVSNLLNNAMKFTKDLIEVKCEKMAEGNKFMISVKDNGIGISKENQEKIFNPFFQVLDNINETKGGTGLGLSIVKSVIDAHGGEIRLESNPGHGSIFTVILPMRQDNVLPTLSVDEISAQQRGEIMSPSDDEPAAQEDPVLLVVDDNKEMVDFISSHFERNYEIMTASNGLEALEKMDQKPVSLIICDWMMPEMDGEEFLRKIRNDENYSHIPFVMLTAKTDNASKITSMKSGADAYVEKPFSINYLDARIANLLDMRALLRKKYSRMPLEPITTIAQTEVDNELLKKLQSLIEENFSNPDLNVDFIAERLAISRSGLYAKIRSLADVTPNELIQITRLKKAAELLAENKYRVNEICYMVGFNSSSYFSRCFQKQFGMKPGEFAAKHK